MNDHTVIGWAEDLDISGSIDPFDTPQMGDWLNNRAPEFDIIACWKLDRLSRNTININGLFAWCIKYGKSVVSVTESIDLGTPVGRLIANVLAFLAEGELEAIRERTKAGRQKVVALGRWPGGPAPYGFTAVKLDGGGFKLAPRPDQVEVIKRISDLILSGLSMEAVAKRLNDDGVPSPTGKKWRSARLFLIMESRLLLGHSTYKGQTVRDAQGMPVMVSEPILEADEWDRLQAAIQARRLPSAVKRTQNTSPLYGVIFCKSCGSMMYNRKYGHRESDRGYTYDYYMCPKSCGRMIHAELIYKLLETVFLSEVGNEKVRERVHVPAESHETELKEAQRAVDEITPLLGVITSETMRKQLTTQLLAIDSRIKSLESIPVRESHWEYLETGGTYAQAWESANDLAVRRDLLIKSGITVHAFKPKTTAALEFEMEIPPDIRQQMGLGPRQSSRVTVTDVLTTLRESGIAGIETNLGRYANTLAIHPADGGEPVVVHNLTDEGEAQAAEFYGWDAHDPP